MNEYTWIWEGQTQKGSCQWVTWDGALRSGTPFHIVENDIIGKTKATYYATVVAEFIKQCNAQGITATLSSVDVQCEIVKDPLQKSCYYVSRGEHYQCSYTQNFIVKVKGTVVFESPQDLAASPIAPALIIALAKAIALIIVAIGVGWGVYEFLRNLTLNETRSTVTKKTVITNPSDLPVTVTLPDGSTVTIPPDGTYTSESAETASTKQPSATSWIGIIVMGGLVLGALVVLPKLLEERKGRRR